MRLTKISSILLSFYGSVCLNQISLANPPIPISVGKGSYASSIPSDMEEFWAGDIVNVKEWHENVDLHLLDSRKRPIPTNDWWSPLLFHNNVETSHNLWAHPINVTVQKYGIGFHFPDTWTDILGGYADTVFLQNPEPLKIKGADFNPARQLVKNWGDWTVQFRVLENDSKYMDVTIGHGMPTTWIEFHGVSEPKIEVGSATFFDINGKPLSLPYRGDHLGVKWNGRNYGVFAPDNTIFTLKDGAISIKFNSTDTYLVVSALPSKEDIKTFHKYAFALPDDSKVEWQYDREAGKVHTKWKVKTRLLKGNERGIIQGWIPHHYRNTVRNFSFNGIEYTSARGKLKCSANTEFKISYNFNGALTALPVPGNSEFDMKRQDSYIDKFSEWSWDFNSETYAGGKQVGMFARQLSVAEQIKHPKRNVIKSKLKGELENFLTYTPNEKDKFFGYSERFGGLVGFRCGFGSHRFNDHHFHYGYYVYASGVLGNYDSEFLANYGEMAKLVAKEFANWDRSDKRFPFFRTFDIWEGHSWAGGGHDNSTVFGSNQESSSEAMMSWSGMIALGNTLNDSDLTAAGVFGYVMEAEATNEYWFDRYDTNFPDSFGPKGKISTITWGNQLQYITYFGAEPILVHGIEYIPVLPSSYYLVRNFDAAQTEFNYMLSNSKSDLYTRFKTRDSWEEQWANVVFRYASLFNPDWSLDWYESLWNSQDTKATNSWEGGVSYYQMHANKSLGRIQWDSYISAPNSGVFYNNEKDLYTYIAHNPTNKNQTYNIYKNRKKIGEIRVPARSFYSSHSLIPESFEAPNISLLSPVDGDSFETDMNGLATVPLRVDASDSDGFIAKVVYFDGATKIGEVKSHPFDLSWKEVKPGEYTITAIAYDNQGLKTSSRSATISVTCESCKSTCSYPDEDYLATITNDVDPTITFTPKDPIKGCRYVIVVVYKDHQIIGSYYMTKEGESFKHTIHNTPLGTNLKWTFTYSVPSGGERNTLAHPDETIVGQCVDKGFSDILH